MKLVLEARHLFDGSVVAVAHHAAHADHAHHHHDASHTPGPAHAHHHHGAHQHHHDPLHSVDIPALAFNPHATEIVFIDTRVANWQTLAAGVKSNVQVVLIDPNRDGLTQVTEALKGHHNLQAIDFVSYGSPGQVQLGDSTITADSLAGHAAQVASWRDHLSDNAEINFWGCDVGQGSSGQSFVASVHALTGAQVDASTDATGAAALGGNWNLELRTGALAYSTPFEAAALAAYQGVLDSPLPTVSFEPTTVPASVLVGGTFTETIDFTNGAATAVGYGPFIDLFVPQDAAQSATLTGASYLGQAVTVDPVTLSTTIPGHVGVLGALHPLAVDSSGNPLFVAAPAGYTAGDVMYVLVLPFGSFTPGQPAATIDLSFAVAGTTELTSAHGQALNISAIGGFQYGADALNDPGTDPSIRGTTTHPGTTDNTDGMAQTSTAVDLVEVSATTDLHEGETATGPDYPFNYIVTLTPAPVTQSDPINGFDFTFNLPPQVQYDGPFTVPGATVSFSPGPLGADHAGGTVTVHFDSLAANGGGTPTTFAIPVFVPQNDSSGHAVLDPTTGAPVTVSGASLYSYSGNWNPPVGSVDHQATAEAFSGDSSTNIDSAAFTAKSLAIQVVDENSSTVVPGAPVQYQINFEVSDYFSLSNLNIADVLGDGMTLLAPGDAGYMAPTLSITRDGTQTTGLSFGDATTPVADVVNGQTVAESGGNTVWSYSRDDSGATAAPGSTTLAFNVGMLLSNQFGGALGGVLQGGGDAGGATQGSITFTAKVLDKYTNTKNEDSVREKDQITDSVTTTGTSASVVTVAGGVATPTGASVSDDSSVTDQVAAGHAELKVVAVNGDSSNTTVIHPGDTVTYGITYDLTSGDYGNLNLTAYLPEPVFSTSDPTATASAPVSAFTQDTNGGDVYPSAGQYILTNPGTGESVHSATVDGTANSISFDLGTRDDPTNAPGQSVTVYFSVVASSDPYANGLQLTSQATSSYVNAGGVTVAAAAIKQETLTEPEVQIKTGVVSVINNGGTSKGTYTADPANPNSPWTTQSTGTAPSGDPQSPFGVAGTALGSTDPLTGNGTPLSADDLSVAGVDGGDVARVVSTVANNGGATAYDVTLHGSLPTGYSATDITNFAIYDSTGHRIDTSVTAAQYFAGTATLTDGIAGGSAVYVVYDLPVHAGQSAGATLDVGAAVTNWAAAAGGVAAGQGFVTAGQPVGENAAELSDGAAINITAPTITKTITGASDSTDVPLGAQNNVVLGETVQYGVTLTVPEGSITNNGSDITITDVLPDGMSFVSLDSVTAGSGINYSGTPTTSIATVNGHTVLTVDLHVTSLTNTNVDAPATFTLNYSLKVTDATPQAGHTYVNDASLQYDGAPISHASASATQVDPAVTETVGVTDTGGNPVTTLFSGETLDYTVALHNAASGSQANNLDTFVAVPTSDLQLVGAPVVNGDGDGSNPTVTDVGPTTIGGVTYEIYEITDTALKSNGTDTLTFSATVNPNLPAGTQITVGTPDDGTQVLVPGHENASYNSLPTSVGPGHDYTTSGSLSTSIAALAPTLSIIGEANDTSGNGTGLYGEGVSSVAATVGDLVRYSATVQIPEGQQNDLQVTVTLPSGMQFQNDGTITLMLTSPDGSITAVNFGSSASTAYGSSFDAGAAKATFNLPSSDITVHPDGSVTFDLGQINDNEGSAQPNYAIVQFTGIVANAAGVVDGTSLAAHATVGTQNSADATVTVDEPNVTLTKTVTSVDNGDGTASIHITETVTNNSADATAYNVALDDPEGSNTGVLSGVTETGAGGLVIINGNGTRDLQASGSLAAGASNTFTYVETVSDATQGVSDATATVTYTSLSNAAGGVGGETLAGSVTGALGSATGSRDGNDGPGGLNDYVSQATIGFGVASGHVWNDIGPDASQFGEVGSHDTNLSGVTVTGDFGGVTETAATDANGDYSMIVVEGAGTISMPTPGTGGLASNETLAYNDGNAITTPVTITATPGTAQTNVDFSFRTPDTAPVIAGWGDSTVNPANPVSVTYTEGGAPVGLATGASITDTQIDETSHDYDGSVLTVQRYNSDGSVDTNPTDTAHDQFVGTGLLVLGTGADTTVTYNGSLVGHYTEVNGVLKLTFDAGVTSAATVNSVLDAIGYQSTDSNTLSTGIKIGATLDDHNQGQQQGTTGDMTSAPAFVTVYETPASGAVTFTDPNDTSATAAAVAVDGNVTVSSSDTFDSATVSFGANYQPGEDVLAGGTAGGFTSSFDTSTGVLTLTKAGATAAQLQAALRSVTYNDALDIPNTAARTLDISVHDHTTGVDTPLSHVTVTVAAENDSPVLHDTPVTLADAPGDGAAPSGEVGTLVSALTGGGNVTDTDGANAHDGATPGLNGIAITAADTSVGTWWYTTNDGATWTAFASGSLPAISDSNALHLVADANTRIYFQASTAQSGGVISQALTFRGWDQYDHVANGTLSALPTDSALGTGVGTDASAYSQATQTLPLQIDSDHTVNQTFTEPNGTASDANAVTVDGTVVLSSTDTYSSATVTIGNAQGEDHLIFTPSADTGDISAAFNGGVLTLTSAGGHATAAQIQAALRAVQYFDSSDTPITTQRTLSLSAHDATTGTDVALDATTMTIVPANDSPVLHGDPVTLGDAAEDAGPPSGALGTLVSSLTGGGNVTDTDGANAHDGSTPGTTGIAVVGADTSQGSWWYSTDGGNTWSEFAGAGLPAVSDSNALHLVGDANTRIYFEPNHNWNGVIPTALTMRGWDQNDGAANGSLSALPTDSALGTGSNTLASAYSSATQSLQLAVTAANDAPVASGGASLAPTTEDTANQPGDTVSDLFSGSFNDSADQQQSVGNPSGSMADSLAGIAITGNAATADQGAWQYSTDNGAHWTTVPTGGLGDANAIVLPDSAELRFVPSANFNGTPGQLTTRLIDSSSSVVTAGLTGLDLSTGSTAFTGVDVSGAHNGGTTAVSASSVGLDTLVTAVNDAPLASGDATLPPTPSGEQNPPGDTVDDLFGGSFNDSTDQQHSATNPTGSNADTLAGIAITGNAATTGGNWQYSTDGVNWTTVPTDLGEHDALILAAGTKLRFISTPGFIGEPGALTAHLIDSSAGPVAGATSGVDLGTTGGITPYSSATVHLNTEITRDAGVPIRSTPGNNAPLDPSLAFDSSYDAGDQGFIGDNDTAFTPDFLHRPIIPQVELIGSVGNRFVIVEQRSVIAVPSNLFVDSYPNAVLQYEARSPAGGALPPWLTFDPRNLTFTGTPPRSAHGAVDVLIVAHDQFGNEATASFRILVGRDSDDLQHLLAAAPSEARQVHQAAGAARHATQHGHARHPQRGHDGAAHTGNAGAHARTDTGTHAHGHAQDQGHPQIHAPRHSQPATLGASLDGAEAAHGRAAFSAQLREAGPTGRLLQARQILDALAQIVPIEPIA